MITLALITLCVARVTCQLSTGFCQHVGPRKTVRKQTSPLGTSCKRQRLPAEKFAQLHVCS